MDRPIRYAIRMSQRLVYGTLSASSHLSIAQKTMAVNNEDVPYTSLSTAENQNVSENV